MIWKNMTIEFLKIPLSFVNKLEQLDYKKEKFDSECTRYTGRTDLSLIDLKELPDFFDKSNIVVHKLVYDFKGIDEYELSKHSDASLGTLLIYLDKDSTVNEQFYIKDSNGKIREPLKEKDVWSRVNGYRQGVLFYNENDMNDGGLRHWGKFKGHGSRKIVCLFFNEKN
jgi:hypothetical protein